MAARMRRISNRLPFFMHSTMPAAPHQTQRSIEYRNVLCAVRKQKKEAAAHDVTSFVVRSLVMARLRFYVHRPRKKIRACSAHFFFRVSNCAMRFDHALLLRARSSVRSYLYSYAYLFRFTLNAIECSPLTLTHTRRQKKSIRFASNNGSHPLNAHSRTRSLRLDACRTLGRHAHMFASINIPRR